MNNKKQVFIELNDWLRTPRGMAKNTYAYHHTTGFYPWVLQQHVLKRRLWKNSVFLSLSPWAPLHVPISPTPTQAALLLENGGAPSPEWPLGYLATLVPGSSRKTMSFLAPGTELSLVMRWHNSQVREKHRETVWLKRQTRPLLKAQNLKSRQGTLCGNGQGGNHCEVYRRCILQEMVATTSGQCCKVGEPSY